VGDELMTAPATPEPELTEFAEEIFAFGVFEVIVRNFTTKTPAPSTTNC